MKNSAVISIRRAAAPWCNGWGNPVSGNGFVGRLGFLILVWWAFWSGPAVGSAAERWRFIMTCDSRGGASTGINEQIVAELVQEIQRWNADFVLFPGDLVYGARIGAQRFESQLRSWVNAMEPIYDAGIAVYVCRGNHEVGDMWDAEPGQPPPLDNYAIRWLNVFGNDDYPGPRLPDNGPADEKHMSYSVVHKNALIVAVDEYAGVKHQLAHYVNQPWLDSLLEKNTKPHVFVFGHEPAFQALHPDCLAYYPDRRDAFWHSLKMAGARVYLCGHDHFYDHAWVDDGDGNPGNDIHQLIVGSAGAYPYMWFPPYDGNNSSFNVTQVSHAESYGYVVVEVNDLNVTMTWMQRQNNDLQEPGVYEAKDVWSYKVAPGPVVLQPNGGERVSGGRPYTVRWRTVDGLEVNRVVIEYSLDGGESWATADEVNNTGAYEWTAPSVNSNTCLVRVRDARDGTISDAGDGLFSIVTCQTKLTADLNGDCRVDFADLAILAGEWLAQGNPSDPPSNPQK